MRNFFYALCKRYLEIKPLLIFLCALYASGSWISASEGYLDYKTYAAMKALVPELREAGLAGGLAPAGYELWRKGQARIPITGNFLTAQFRQSGDWDSALLLQEKKNDTIIAYVLIATQTPKGWSRLFLQRLEEPGGIRWDAKKKAIEIGTADRTRMTAPATMQWAYGQKTKGTYGYALDVRSPAYIRWNSRGKQFDYFTPATARFQPWMLKANLESYVRDFTLEQFVGVHLKFTYFGPQDEPYPGLILSAPGYVPNLEFFKIYRRPGIDYGNDEARILWSAVLMPTELRDVVSAIYHVEGLETIIHRKAPEQATVFSLSILYIDSDPRFCELLLTWQETKKLLSNIAKIVEPKNSPAYAVLRNYLTMFGD